MMRARAVGVVFAMALTVAGCGLSLKGGSTTRANAATSAVAQAQRTHEIPTPAPHVTAPGGWRSPVHAVQVFAQAYINWTTDTVASRRAP